MKYACCMHEMLLGIGIFDCADHAATHECFRERHRTLQQGSDTWIDTGALRPWTSLGWLCKQGRVDPRWEIMIARLQHGARRRASPETVIQELLCASLETWYHAIWLPRCQQTISQEQSQGLHYTKVQSSAGCGQQRKMARMPHHHPLLASHQASCTPPRISATPTTAFSAN